MFGDALNNTVLSAVRAEEGLWLARVHCDLKRGKKKTHSISKIEEAEDAKTLSSYSYLNQITPARRYTNAGHPWIKVIGTVKDCPTS